jgi:hypothetical protein
VDGDDGWCLGWHGATAGSALRGSRLELESADVDRAAHDAWKAGAAIASLTKTRLESKRQTGCAIGHEKEKSSCIPDRIAVR